MIEPDTQNVPAVREAEAGARPKLKSLFIKTFGCQMNAYDSDRMSELLFPLGYESVTDPETADMVVLNTCHIREKASEKLFSELGRLREIKQRRSSLGKTMIITVAGCVAQAIGEEIVRRAPQVDVVVGPQTYHRLPELIAEIERARNHQLLCTDFPVEPKFDRLPMSRQTSGVSTFLSVQEGCDKFCTFCVVPYTRGAEYSRSINELVVEAKLLVENGVREITLLGQNVNAYHGAFGDGNATTLSTLIDHLAALEGVMRLRYTTSHPRDMDAALIEAHGRVPKLMPSLHLPVQSGSNRILKDMNRGYTVDDYLRTIDLLRESRPDIALSSDFIVGFPGETEADFEATMSLVEKVKYAQAYSFKYSARPGTPAASLGAQIDEATKSERLQTLQKLLTDQQSHFNGSMVGRRLEILLEKPGRYSHQLVGRSPYLQAVHVLARGDSTVLNIGDLVEVDIKSSHPNSLTGVWAKTLRSADPQ